MRLHYTKALSLVDSNFKESGDGAYSGYAAVTGNTDLGGDIILKGAFSEWLEKADTSRVRVLWQHDWNNPIGKTLSMREDDNGLAVDGELLLDIQKAQEARTLVKNNAIDGLSIGFMIDDFSYDNDTRIIKKLSVMEYSFVTFAMNPNALVNDMKSCKLETVRDCEHYLRDVCKLSQKEAKTLLSKLKAARDDAPDYNDVAALLVKLNQTLRGQK